MNKTNGAEIRPVIRAMHQIATAYNKRSPCKILKTQVFLLPFKREMVEEIGYAEEPTVMPNWPNSRDRVAISII